MVPIKRSPPSSDEDNEQKPRADEEQVRARKRHQVRPVHGPPIDNVARAVTPGTHQKPGRTTTAGAPEQEDDAEGMPDSSRRALFASPSSSGRAAAITPLKDPSPTKRKLIFGRSVVETVVKDSVRQVYTIIRKLTGSIGGNGAFGPIYGELTMGSMQKMVNLMKEHTGFDSSSRFIDVGSGIGKPNLHVTQDPGVEFSYGIEIEQSRWLLGLNCLKGVLDAAYEQHRKHGSNDGLPEERIHHRCIFVLGDIRGARSFDPFTHVYMFSIGFPPALWCVLSDMWNRSTSQYLICYHGPKDIIGNYEFDVELVTQTPTSMHGSKEGHMGYIYRRTATTMAPSNSASGSAAPAACDPYFAGAWKIVQSGLETLKEEVDAKVEENMQSGTSTRAKRLRG